MFVRVRPSAADRFVECATSAMHPAALHDPSSTPQRGGSAAHEAIQHRIDTGEEPDTDAIARRWGLVDDTEVSIPYAMFRRAWRTLEPYFPAPQAELQVTSELTGGTCDLASITPERISVADWKAGRVQRDNRYQMASYAYCLRSQYGMPTEGIIRGVTVYLRQEHWTVVDFSDADLDAFEHRMTEQAGRVGIHVAAGEHCAFCPRRLECDTRAAYLRAGIALLTSDEPRSSRQLAELYPLYQQVTAALDDYHTALRSAAAHGEIPMGEGRTLRLREQARKSIRPLQAWPILQAQLSADELAEAVTVGKGKIERLIKAKAQRGDKGKAAAAILSQLSEAGAIQETAHTRLEVCYGSEETAE